MLFGFLGTGDQFQHPLVEANRSLDVDAPILEVDHQAGQGEVLAGTAEFSCAGLSTDASSARTPTFENNATTSVSNAASCDRVRLRKIMGRFRAAGVHVWGRRHARQTLKHKPVGVRLPNFITPDCRLQTTGRSSSVEHATRPNSSYCPHHFAGVSVKSLMVNPLTGSLREKRRTFRPLTSETSTG